MTPIRHRIAAGLYIASLLPVAPWLALRGVVWCLGRAHAITDDWIDAAEDTVLFTLVDSWYWSLAQKLWRWSRRG